ncbi:MAG: thiamine pyrophosphate-dependent dehydrogenase E1 component subunit alpha [Gammaproteobacteria bacterium]|nr:thiamine pyrophosphate-dependent dehydrogenase E1 component subunit alpha [Gammaproteobacteria bacterium]
MHPQNISQGLGELVDPLKFNHPLNLCGLTREKTFSLLKNMLTIRIIEEKISHLIVRGVVKTPCHLGTGQEAIAVGISENLTKHDYAFGTHRSHSHYLAMGGGVYELIAEVLGKKEGASKGMGGSMHLYGGEVGFMGSVPIVGATIPIAVGAAMAAKMDNNQAIAVCFFGDGAAEEGVLHESLNLASAYNLPVLFVCENNLYSSHLDINLRQPCDRVARFAQAHCIEAVTIDGNDVVGVRDASLNLIKKMRSECRPGFIEAVTYRWCGHVGPDENIDVGVRRSKSELDAWKQRDPIKRLRQAMMLEESLTESSYLQLVDNINGMVDEAIIKAEKAPYPKNEALYDLVYEA